MRARGYKTLRNDRVQNYSGIEDHGMMDQYVGLLVDSVTKR